MLKCILVVYLTPLLKKQDMNTTDVPTNIKPIGGIKASRTQCSSEDVRFPAATWSVTSLAVTLAYRRHHSIETAVLRVLFDILHAIDNEDLSVLALLDLSAAFDAGDHEILLQRIKSSFGVGGLALEWFRSYLTTEYNTFVEAHPVQQQGGCGLDYHRYQCWVHFCGYSTQWIRSTWPDLPSGGSWFYPSHVCWWFPD